MEKLIELLNEYEIWKWKNGLDITQQYAEHNFKYNKWLYIRVISKKYKFIKRLVENDKIDTNNLNLKAFKNIFSGGWFVEVSDLEVLLMLLSIEDEPIEFLVSLLK